MNMPDSRPDILQAFVSLCVIGLIGAIALLTVTSNIKTIATKLHLLDTRKENVEALEARLVATHEDIVPKLAGLDIVPTDLPNLADPAQTKERLQTVCEQALNLERSETAESPLSCIISETPFDNAAAIYQARATISGDIGSLAARLPNAVRPPVRVISLSVAAGAAQPETAIAFELVGARSGETP